MAGSDNRRLFEATALPFLAALHRTARRLAGREEDAEELTQETYLRAYRTFDNFRPGTNCRAWLFTILYSVFINRYRARKREAKTIPLEEMEERFHRCLTAEADGALPSAPGGAPQWSDRDVEAAVQELPESFREAVLLVDVGELSYEQAAAALGCPVGTVRSRLFRARKQLYVALQEHARLAGYDTSKKREPE